MTDRTGLVPGKGRAICGWVDIRVLATKIALQLNAILGRKARIDTWSHLKWRYVDESWGMGVYANYLGSL